MHIHTATISVIIPVYNTEKYLSRCLKSVINQTYNNLEIICVNDGSTDNSLKILQKYATLDQRVQIITQNNTGLSGARNRGILRAKSSFVMFIDSDDTIEKNMAETLYQKIIEDESDLVIGSYRYLDKSGVIEKVRSPIDMTLSQEVLFKKILANEISPSACICIYKKSLFTLNNLFFPEKLYYEDLAFQYKIAFAAQSISIINQPLYNYYHLHSHSISNHIEQKHILDIFQIFNDTTLFLKQKQIFTTYQSFLIIRIYSVLQYLLLKMSRNHLDQQHVLELLASLWEKAYVYEEFLKIPYSKKINLIFLSISLIKDDKFYDFFHYFKIQDTVMKNLCKYKQSPLGLMQGCIEYLKSHPEIKNLYIYGAGDILKLILPEFENLGIHILDIIDQKEKKIQYKDYKFISKSLLNVKLQDGDTVLIASIAFKDEIIKDIQKLYFQKKINIINFEMGCYE